ncbi:MAG: type I secretion system permease/ATPase [Sphingomonas sp.]
MTARSELAAILGHFRHVFWGIGILSAVLNVLLLAGSIYMMLVYDLVLPSRSVPTLLSLFAMLTLIYAFQAGIDLVRGRLLLHLSSTLDIGLGPRIHRLIGELARTSPRADALQPMRDLDQVRGFMSGTGPTTLVDLPWMFFFTAILFLLHPLIGLTVLVGALLLIGITFLTDRLSTDPIERMSQFASQRHMLADSSRRHAEVARALGMEGRLRTAWTRSSNHYMTAQARMSNVASTMGGISKILRMLLQSAVLTVGALLVMQGRASGGVIFASSILSSRALAPVELAIANWRGFGQARTSWARLRKLFDSLPKEEVTHELPRPHQTLMVEGLTLAPAGGERPTVNGVTFGLRAGQALAVLGPSGCGKSTLVRGLVGALRKVGGEVRLDGAAIEQWESETLGGYIGYLPQNVELLGGTVTENIARFEPDAPAELVVAAARLAGVHDLILHLPDGYGTQVGPDGSGLSAGQRQRIALARALYRDPFLVVLDEPNSNLDAAGEQALAEAVRATAARGAIVVLVAHRPSILSAVDLVLLMHEGRVRNFGPKEQLVPELLPKGGAPIPHSAV